MPFEKGQSGNPAGRRAGKANGTTKQFRQAARDAIDCNELCQLWATWAREGNMTAAKLLAVYGYGMPQAGGDVEHQDWLDANEIGTGAKELT